ncbi:MAG TPA: glycosyltransferase family 1 protein, partial [Candidatus Kryptonia bacterium]|nr:glycosyltransferase family 1 protein [Candidatus Kryptonia bacterium]
TTLTECGWRLSDPQICAATPDAYREYIWRSRGEFSAAKHGYVAGRTGWFSDRSACYLAAGRPVILQDTGFSRHLPVGHGLMAFEDSAGAVAAVRAVEADYASHARGAHELAREYFDARRVLPRLLEVAGL